MTIRLDDCGDGGICVSVDPRVYAVEALGNASGRKVDVGLAKPTAFRAGLDDCDRITGCIDNS